MNKRVSKRIAAPPTIVATGKCVTLCWSEYHQLSTNPGYGIFSSLANAQKFAESSTDRVVGHVSIGKAHQIVNAFTDLAVAQWTPNQSEADKANNAVIAANATKVLEMA